jgi:hypothetical protein
VTALALAAGLWLGAWACTDEITAPGRCPELCPSDTVEVADTMLEGIVVWDTSVRGYTDLGGAPILILARQDSVQVYGLLQFAAVPQQWQPQTDTGLVSVGSYDSVQVQVFVEARDTAAKNLRILLYRLPSAFDTTMDFTEAAPYFADSLVLDSVAVGDSVTVGLVTGRVATDRFLPAAADSFAIALGLAVRADRPTTVLLGATEFAGSPVRLLYYGRGAPPRDSLTRTLETSPTYDGLVSSVVAGAPAPGTVVVGSQPAARSFLRFDVPSFLLDSAVILRATLELHLLAPVSGVPGQSLPIQAAPVIRYFGGKSVIFGDTLGQGRGTVTVGDTGTAEIEMARVLRLWRRSDPDSLPRVVELRALNEIFNLSELTAAGGAGPAAPRLRVTFQRPFRFGVP